MQLSYKDCNLKI